MPSAMDKPAAPANDNGDLTGRPCAICGKPALVRFKPFCSRRCADVDLNRWLTGSYAIPVEEGRDRPSREGDSET
jgi:uncharacterized protein